MPGSPDETDDETGDPASVGSADSLSEPDEILMSEM
jgi:hypothetical protein